MMGGTRVDYWRDTIIERGFHGSGQQIGVAGEYPGVQLWNPAASGKILIVDRITSHSNAAKSHRMYYDNAALSTAAYEVSKHFDAALAASGGQVFKDSLAVIANYGTRVSSDIINNDFIKWVEGKAPFMIDPGYGLSIVCSDLETSLRIIFEWIEV